MSDSEAPAQETTEKNERQLMEWERHLQIMYVTRSEYPKYIENSLQLNSNSNKN